MTFATGLLLNELNHDGVTPLDMAKGEGYSSSDGESVVELLKDKGAISGEELARNNDALGAATLMSVTKTSGNFRDLADNAQAAIDQKQAAQDAQDTGAMYQKALDFQPS